MLNNTQTYSDMWQNCLDRIKAQTSEEEFVKWFQPIVPLEFDGTNLRLRVPNESYVHQIEKNYIPFLRPIISQLYGQQTRLHYAVPRSTPPAVPVTADADTTAISRFNTQTNTANIKNPFVIPGLKKIIIDPQLNPGLTFATFIEGECNRLARSAGMSVAVNPGNNPFNPLYIYGDSGLGKTHIVQAIGHEVRQRHPELQVLYVSMNKFQAQFQTAYKNGEIPDFIHFYQMIDVLIIDDIQELTGKTGTQNAFFNIFNHLQLAGKQLILTSDKPPVELKDIEQRLLTRFKWGLSAQLNTPDYDTKLKIIRVKAQKFGAQISDDVVAYLADNISANVREIEGALSSLVANASFLGRKITTSLAKEILKVYVQLYQKEITLDHIIEVVCEYLNLDFARFNSTERTREIAQARQIAMYLAKQHTKAPLTTIGAAIGGRNHATVLHSCKAVSNLIETDKTYADMMVYGVEGVNYTRDSEDVVTKIPDSGWSMGRWKSCNFEIASITSEDSPDLKQKYRDFNNAGVLAELASFSPDYTNMESEMAAVKAVLTEVYHLYTLGFMTTADLPDTVARFEAAGDATMIRELQKQIDAYFAG